MNDSLDVADGESWLRQSVLTHFKLLKEFDAAYTGMILRDGDEVPVFGCFIVAGHLADRAEELLSALADADAEEVDE